VSLCVFSCATSCSMLARLQKSVYRVMQDHRDAAQSAEFFSLAVRHAYPGEMHKQHTKHQLTHATRTARKQRYRQPQWAVAYKWQWVCSHRDKALPQGPKDITKQAASSSSPLSTQRRAEPECVAGFQVGLWRRKPAVVDDGMDVANSAAFSARRSLHAPEASAVVLCGTL
jgi:hypothetical protein